MLLCSKRTETWRITWLPGLWNSLCPRPHHGLLPVSHTREGGAGDSCHIFTFWWNVRSWYLTCEYTDLSTPHKVTTVLCSYIHSWSPAVFQHPLSQQQSHRHKLYTPYCPLIVIIYWPHINLLQQLDLRLAQGVWMLFQGLPSTQWKHVSFPSVGFKFSRASYLLSLLRPQVAKELELKVCLTMLEHLTVQSQLAFCLGDERPFSLI